MAAVMIQKLSLLGKRPLILISNADGMVHSYRILAIGWNRLTRATCIPVSIITAGF